jgi:hypothetical protein
MRERELPANLSLVPANLSLVVFFINVEGEDRDVLDHGPTFYAACTTGYPQTRVAITPPLDLIKCNKQVYLASFTISLLFSFFY